jgi:GNAT superfamily N-acetyltransferase
MSDLIEYVKLEHDRLKDLSKLFLDCGKGGNIEDLNRKYATSNFENEFVGYLAYDPLANKAVAFYGVLPVIAVIHGERVHVAQSADTVTHPDYRKRGLFIKLALLTFELCERLEIKVLFGIPNENSLHGFIKHLNWEIKDYYQVYEKKVLTLPMNFVLHKFGVFLKLYYRYTNFLQKIFFEKGEFFTKSDLKSEGFYILNNEFYQKYKMGSGIYDVSLSENNLLLSVHKYIKLGEVYGSCNNLVSLKRRLVLFAILSGSHKIVFQQLSSSAVHPAIEYLMLDIAPRKGLPLIQRNLNGNAIYNEKLIVKFLDFDTF